MKRLLRETTAAMLTVAIVFVFGAVSQAQTLTQDFEGGTVLPRTNFFVHDGTAFSSPPPSNLSPEGIFFLTSFVGAGGGSPGSASATFGLSATGGVGGSQAAHLTLTRDASTNFVFAGVAQGIGQVPNPTDFTASVDVLAPAGFPLSLRIESDFMGVNDGFQLNFVGTGQYQTISGVVGTDLTPIPGGAFNPALNSIIAVSTQFNGTAPVGFGQDIFVDNFSFVPTPETVPEPSSFAVLLSLGAMVGVRRRRV